MLAHAPASDPDRNGSASTSACTRRASGARSGDETAAEVVKAAGRVLEPDEVAAAVVRGLEEERFLILPHPEVAEYWRRKADDPDRWLAGMRRLQARVRALG